MKLKKISIMVIALHVLVIGLPIGMIIEEVLLKQKKAIGRQLFRKDRGEE